jgi:hypothetical protein
MDGIGSGNRWRYGARSTTDAFRRLDVRYWARQGLLRPGYCGSCRWRRRGEVVASINVRAEEDRVILTYRHRSDTGEWKDQEYPFTSAGRAVGWAVHVLGSCAPWWAAVAV